MALVKPAIEKKITGLLGKMTLAEKIGQLNQLGTSLYTKDDTLPERMREMIKAGQVGSFLSVYGAERLNALQKVAIEESRLGIPLLFGYDVIHGFKTIFPIPLAEAAGWDPATARTSAAVAAKESRAAGLHWTFAPMVDIARDPRWGRIAEGAGEDPYLGAVLAKARVEGFQGDDMSAPDRVVACAKHFAAYGAAEGGRDYNTVNINERTLREIYLPPFAAALEAGVGTFMCAFHDLNGRPCSVNSFLLTDILRAEWGFAGFVVSDAGSIMEVIAHGAVADQASAGQEAVMAGVDMDMGSAIYIEHLGPLVEKGSVPEETINGSVRRILRIKFGLGLFDKPYVDPQREKTVILCPEHRQAARQAARNAIVLLKNEKGLLPLNKDIKSLAVIGPLADNKRELLGTWAPSGDAEPVVSVLAGIRETVSESTQVLYALGSGFEQEAPLGIEQAVAAARQAEAVVLVIGERRGMSGEACNRSCLDIPEAQLRLAKAVQATGKPVVAVLMNGRPITIPWLAGNIPAILETWHLGTEAGHAIADVLFGDHNPGGKLPATFPHTVGQVPLYYNHFNTGRPPRQDTPWSSKYLDAPLGPLYPFGYGLSYTTFEYTGLQLSNRRISSAGTLTVRADIRNTGKRKGVEIAQLYIRDCVSSLVRPVKELKGFKRITLEPGEKQTVEFSLGPRELGSYNSDMKWVVEPGTFKVWVGPDSASGLEEEFTVED